MYGWSGTDSAIRVKSSTAMEAEASALMCASEPVEFGFTAQYFSPRPVPPSPEMRHSPIAKSALHSIRIVAIWAP